MQRVFNRLNFVLAVNMTTVVSLLHLLRTLAIAFYPIRTMLRSMLDNVVNKVATLKKEAVLIA